MIVSILWIVLAILAYGGLHSFLASKKVKNIVKNQLGGELSRYYRLFFNLVALISVLPVLALTVILPDRVLYTLPIPWMWLFVIIQGLALLALAIGLWQTDIWYFIGLRQLSVAEGEKPQNLVVGGLYRWVRHPLYSAGLMFIWFTPRMTLNLLVFNIAITIYIWVGAMFEERKLIEEFGKPYQEYRRRTPMLFPWRIPEKL